MFSALVTIGLLGLTLGFGTDCELLSFALGSEIDPRALWRRWSQCPSDDGQDLADSSPDGEKWCGHHQQENVIKPL